MKLNKILCTILLSFFLLSPLCVKAEDVCFSEETANKIIVDLEKGKNLAEQVVLYQQANKELEYQVQLLKEVNTLRKEEVGQYKELIKVQKDVYEGIIKENKPNIFKQIITGLGYVGLGILIGLVL